MDPLSDDSNGTDLDGIIIEPGSVRSETETGKLAEKARLLMEDGTSKEDAIRQALSDQTNDQDSEGENDKGDMTDAVSVELDQMD